jgi:hypothetical protein
MENYIGKTYGRLTVVKDAEATNGYRNVIVRCICNETFEKIVRLKNLKSGNTTSCGCLKVEVAKEKNTIHGLRKCPIYGVWKKMKQRCENKTNKDYINYGARGIYVCERWQEFQNFYDDMFPLWSSGLTIDRKNNDQGYSPENCRWATRLEQNRNTRKNFYISYIGKTQCLSAWCEELGLKYHTVKRRFYDGKTTEQAFFANRLPRTTKEVI